MDTVRVEVPVPFGVRVTLLGLNEADGSLGDSDDVVSTGATELVRLTVELKL